MASRKISTIKDTKVESAKTGRDITSVQVSGSVFKNFRLICALQGISTKEQLDKFMADWTKSTLKTIGGMSVENLLKQNV